MHVNLLQPPCEARGQVIFARDNAGLAADTMKMAKVWRLMPGIQTTLGQSSIPLPPSVSNHPRTAAGVTQALILDLMKSLQGLGRGAYALGRIMTITRTSLPSP